MESAPPAKKSFSARRVAILLLSIYLAGQIAPFVRDRRVTLSDGLFFVSIAMLLVSVIFDGSSKRGPGSAAGPGSP
jgi:hypothetical protein